MTISQDDFERVQKYLQAGRAGESARGRRVRLIVKLVREGYCLARIACSPERDGHRPRVAGSGLFLLAVDSGRTGCTRANRHTAQET